MTGGGRAGWPAARVSPACPPGRRAVPRPSPWDAGQPHGRALDAAGIDYPAGFTHEVVFRHCPACGQLNIVREEYFVCVFCDEELPQEWNVDGAGR